MRQLLASRRARGFAAAMAAMLLAVGLFLLAVSGLRSRGVARKALPVTEGVVEVAGLGAPLRIDRDSRGLPHVAASSEEDAYFGLGFVHAQDRLAQMLWLRRRARGRAAESLGESALDADRMARSIGFIGLADAQWPNLDARTRRLVTAYAAGVNARMARIGEGAVAPPVLLSPADVPLEPWRPQDSLALLKLYAWGLGESVEASVVLDALSQELGPVAAERFFPEQGPVRSRPEDATVALPHRFRVAERAGALRRALGFSAPSVGSSAWVLGGAHSTSGLPLVAVDHHLPVAVPAWMHLDHVRGGDLDVAGATLPGIPVFWSGHNRSVAWGAVHAGAVVTDLYRETVSPNDPNLYHDGRRWREMSLREERLEVRGARAVRFPVRATAHGPLLPGSEDGEPLSISWTGARIDGESGLRSFLRIARAGDADALRAALEHHHEPALVVVYADTQGAAGTQMAGWIPRRSLSPHLVPLHGRAPWYDWLERVPFDALPSRRLVGGEGFAVAADAPGDAPTGEPIDWLWHSGARASRIEALLAERIREGPLDLRGMAEIQVDVRTAHAERVIAAVRVLADARDGLEDLGPHAREMLGILIGWNGEASAKSRGAAAYHVLLSRLSKSLLGERMGPELWRRYLDLPQIDPESLLVQLLEDGVAEISGDAQRAEAYRTLLRDTLRESWLELSYRLGPNARRWTWGRLHPIRFVDFDALHAGIELGPFPYGGGSHTLRAAAYDPLDPFDVRVASTARLAFDAGSLDQGLAMIAPGQTEHPGDPHFDDQLQGWLDGRTRLLATSALIVEETSVASLRLEPVR